MSQIAFGTKAENLERIAPLLSCACVLPQVRFPVADWLDDAPACLTRLFDEDWAAGRLIVRSSAIDEDGAGQSNAGRYLSVVGVAGQQDVADAIAQVINSYGEHRADDQIFVQPVLDDAALSGVAFTRDPNTGGPYFVINYQDGADTTGVTSGTSSDARVFYCHTLHTGEVPAALAGTIAALRELVGLYGGTPLDVEFAVDSKGAVYIFQVRPLTLSEAPSLDDSKHADQIAHLARRVAIANGPHPYLAGQRTVFGNMPDWNPAEIIGIRPRPLALSLYRDLVTDATWAYQRSNYGYRNQRGFPLMISFGGLPYIDVRVSFNSFIPGDIDDDLAERLVDHYLDKLTAEPTLHDKVEFEVALTCYSLDVDRRLEELPSPTFSSADKKQLADSLRRLTNTIINEKTGLWRIDHQKIEELERRRQKVLTSDLDPISRIYWLIEDCRRYGTLPFAGLARAGFIAVELLRSLVSVGILDMAEYNSFLASLDTVSSRLKSDLATLSRETFLAQYGHLRPGTYDILSARYDEDPDSYFDWTSIHGGAGASRDRFVLSLEQMRRTEQVLGEHGLEHSALGLFEFIRAGIEGREYAKFVFTRSLSDALSLLRQYCEDLGIDADDASYADFSCVRELLASSLDPQQVLMRSIAEGRERHCVARHIALPPLITRPEDVSAFHMPISEPNFVTLRSVTAPVHRLDDGKTNIDGSIVMAPNADPGHDWIFSHNIVGLITMYGGANSHMAIRAGELGIPAVIGAGPVLFEKWLAANRLAIDGANRQVRIIK